MSATHPDGFSLRAGWVVLARVVAGLVQLAGTAILVRALVREDFGSLAFLLLLHQTAIRFVTAGLPESVLYFLPRNAGHPGRQKTVVLQAIALLAIAGLIAAGTLAGAAHWLALLESRQGLESLIPLLAIAVAVEMPSHIIDRVQLAAEQQTRSAVTSVVLSVGSVCATALPAILGAGLETILWSTIAFAAFRLLVLGVVVHLLFGHVRREPLPNGIREQLRYAFPLGLTALGGYVNQQLDKYLVAAFFDAAAFATYTVGARELPLVSVLPYTLGAVMLPRLVRHIQAPGEGPDAAMSLWHASIAKTATIMLPVSVFFFVAADPFIHAFFTPEYAAAAGPFRIYLCALPLRVATYGHVVQAFGNPRAVLIGSTGALAINGVLSFAFLLGPLGILGPPLAAVFAQGCAVVYLLHVIRICAGRTWSMVFPWRAYARVAVVALVAALPAVPVVVVLRQWPVAALVAGAFVYLGAYLAVGSRTGIVTRDDRRYLVRLLTFRGAGDRSPAG